MNSLISVPRRLQYAVMQSTRPRSDMISDSISG
jgi:hypothetical protein